ncbi:MAG TPA: hypothetical protein VF403_10050 [Kofleriaceae bacterium]
MRSNCPCVYSYVNVPSTNSFPVLPTVVTYGAALPFQSGVTNQLEVDVGRWGSTSASISSAPRRSNYGVGWL